MRGFVDLHCHWIPAIDDGARTDDEAVAMLRALHDVGFDRVVATPHIRPALFDNRAPALRDAFSAVQPRLERERAAGAKLPEIALSAEHFFDDIVFGLMMAGEGLPYPVGRSILVEFAYEALPVAIEARFFDIRRKRLRPIVAHPERYEPFWRKPAKAAESMRRAGGVLLLDVAALVGKYGSKAQRTAEVLVEEGAYYAACSDAHRPEDAVAVGRGIDQVRRLVGDEEVDRLMRKGPTEILEGRILDAYD